MKTSPASTVAAILILSASAGWSAPPVMIPRVVGEWWTIAQNPDLGAYNTTNQQPVDFAVWQAADGTWQLWSCIRNTRCGGVTRLLHGWEGRRVGRHELAPRGITMEAMAEFGERTGGLQAPFVLRHDSQFLMFYGDWVHVCVATSRDGKAFARRLHADGKTGMFGEGPNDNARDPMVLFTRDRWHCYYTAHPNREGAVFCRTSSDLRTWSDPRRVAFGGEAGTHFTSAECPFVVELTPGEYYLLRTQRYGADAITRVYHSRDPLDFGVDNDGGHLVGTLPIAAPEIFPHEGHWYIASLLPTLNGIRLAKMEWVNSASASH